MKIIFDENVPHPLKQFFKNHDVSTVQENGWAGVENGRILDLVDTKFDVLLLADKNLRYQQNLGKREIAIIELPTNRWPILKSIASRILKAVEQSHPGQYTILASE